MEAKPLQRGLCPFGDFRLKACVLSSPVKACVLSSSARHGSVSAAGWFRWLLRGASDACHSACSVSVDAHSRTRGAADADDPSATDNGSMDAHSRTCGAADDANDPSATAARSGVVLVSALGFVMGVSFVWEVKCYTGGEWDPAMLTREKSVTRQSDWC